MDWAKFFQFFLTFAEKNPQLVEDAFVILLKLFISSPAMQSSLVSYVSSLNKS